MTEYDFENQPEAWVTEYNWKQVPRYKLFKMTDEEILKAYPKSVEMGKEYGRYLILLFEKEQEFINKYPNAFCPYIDHFGCPYPIKDHEIIERRIGNDVFSEWYSKTPHYNEQRCKAKQQINAYFQYLNNDRERLADTRDNLHDNFETWRLNKNLKETEKLSRR